MNKHEISPQNAEQIRRSFLLRALSIYEKKKEISNIRSIGSKSTGGKFGQPGLVVAATIDRSTNIHLTRSSRRLHPDDPHSIYYHRYDIDVHTDLDSVLQPSFRLHDSPAALIERGANGKQFTLLMVEKMPWEVEELDMLLTRLERV